MTFNTGKPFKMPEKKKRGPGAGRPKGAANKATALREKAIAASGLTPLAYMIQLMRDETQEQPVRLDAAKAAAPFVHPRLNAIAVNQSSESNLREWMTKAIESMTDDDDE